jgi:hypothetical protein
MAGVVVEGEALGVGDDGADEEVGVADLVHVVAEVDGLDGAGVRGTWALRM